jgi:hypothetical protein
MNMREAIEQADTYQLVLYEIRYMAWQARVAVINKMASWEIESFLSQIRQRLDHENR